MAIAKSKEDADTKAREVKYFTSQFCMPLLTINLNIHSLENRELGKGQVKCGKKNNV